METKMRNRYRWISVLIGMLATTTLAEINIIPRPNKITTLPGELNLCSKVKLTGSFANLLPLKNCTARIFEDASVGSEGKPTGISFEQGGDDLIAGYELAVKTDGVYIKAASPSDAFYALQTLKQLALLSENGRIPCLLIKDAPRYAWRGFMLDESRHFFGKEKVKELLDFMALYKLNRFHWHLTDSDGWRIEIKKYPKLTSVGAIGNHSDKNAPATFYTQEDIKEIVQYASDRFIEIIPEIDMPGHAAAAVRAYPEIGGGGSKKHPDFTFNPGKEQTYIFLTDVLREITLLFPFSWIHYGGDEVHFANKQWLEIPEVKELMARKNLKTLTDVEHYFNRRMEKIISGLGRNTAGWDEGINAGLDPDSTLVFWWRHNMREILAEAFKKKYMVVLCPRIPCYFDFVQDDSHQVGRRWNGFSSLDLLYAFPAGLDLVESQVAGIQANLWTETVVTEERFDFMIFPRLLALAESAWTPSDHKDYDSFLNRLNVHFAFMKRNGIYYFNPFEQSEHPEPGE